MSEFSLYGVEFRSQEGLDQAVREFLAATEAVHERYPHADDRPPRGWVADVQFQHGPIDLKTAAWDFTPALSGRCPHCGNSLRDQAAAGRDWLVCDKGDHAFLLHPAGRITWAGRPTLWDWEYMGLPDPLRAGRKAAR